VALSKAITANPREGWVRASRAVGPEVTAEISRLSAENAKLRTQAAEALRETESEREAELNKANSHLVATSNELSYKYKTGDRSWQHSDKVNNARLFDILAPSLLTEASVKSTSAYLALMVRADESRTSDIVALNQVQELFADFMALDLVMPSTRKHSVKDAHEYWSLTEFGKDLHKMQRRRKLMDEVNRPTRPAKDPKKITPKKITPKVTPQKITPKVTPQKITRKKITPKVTPKKVT
jgi:hypothetical protein